MQAVVKSLFIILAIFVSSSTYSSDHQTGEDYFKQFAIQNNLMAWDDVTIKNLDLAWKHQLAIRTMAKENDEFFPDMLADGEIETLNKMGCHWGFGPAITVEVAKHIRPYASTQLLEIGSCYGFDALALIDRKSVV